MQPLISSNSQGVTLFNWNVKGLGNPIKRAKVFTHLKSLCSDSVSAGNAYETIGVVSLKVQLGHIFLSTFSSKARGVAFFF